MKYLVSKMMSVNNVNNCYVGNIYYHLNVYNIWGWHMSWFGRYSTNFEYEIWRPGDQLINNETTIIYVYLLLNTFGWNNLVKYQTTQTNLLIENTNLWYT